MDSSTKFLLIAAVGAAGLYYYKYKITTPVGYIQPHGIEEIQRNTILPKPSFEIPFNPVWFGEDRSRAPLPGVPSDLAIGRIADKGPRSITTPFIAFDAINKEAFM